MSVSIFSLPIDILLLITENPIDRSMLKATCRKMYSLQDNSQEYRQCGPSDSKLLECAGINFCVELIEKYLSRITLGNRSLIRLAHVMCSKGITTQKWMYLWDLYNRYNTPYIGKSQFEWTMTIIHATFCGIVSDLSRDAFQEMQFFEERPTDMYLENLLYRASYKGHMNGILWCIENGATHVEDALTNLVEHSDFDIADDLVERFPSLMEEHLSKVTENAHHMHNIALDGLKWYIKHGLRVDRPKLFVNILYELAEYEYLDEWIWLGGYMFGVFTERMCFWAGCLDVAYNALVRGDLEAYNQIGIKLINKKKPKTKE